MREHWDGWLTLLTNAERFPLPNHLEQFFAVAWLSLEPRRYRVVLGEAHEIAAAVGSVYTANFVSIHVLLRQLRTNARRANITLPEPLAIAPNEPGYENWRAEIRAYQERAGARAEAKARAKAKGRRPKRLQPTE